MRRLLTPLLLLALAAPAQAVEDCPDAPAARTILSGQGLLESVIGGPNGELYFTDTDKQALMRMSTPDAQPEIVADGIESPGGLLVGLDGRSIIQGYGDGFVQGAAGNLIGLAGLLRIDVRNGAKTTLATGTSMSNGLARDLSGAIYASDDAGTGIDKIVGDQVQRNWAQVVSGNGLAVSADGEYLFVNQTFQPAAVQRVEIDYPQNVDVYATPGPTDIAAGLDGLTIDQDDRLFAAANGAGEVWRIDTDGSICAVARGLGMPSAVAFGSGGDFPVTNLYAVTFGGDVVEIPGARESGPPPLRLRVRPRILRAKKRTRLRITVLRGAQREPGARVQVRARVRRTNPRGRAFLFVRPRRAGILRVRASAVGMPAAVVRVRVLEPTKRPQAVTEP